MNPLPENAVGPRLLVRLQAEKVLKNLKLKEAWEGDDGWSFDDLCAVTACALGEGFYFIRELPLPGRMLAKHGEMIGRIAKGVSPVLVDEPHAGATFVQSEAYQGLLILGLGTPALPFKGSPNLSDTGQLAEALADALNIEVDRINTRKFEHAKREVKKRYAEHQANMEERERRGYVLKRSKLTDTEKLGAAWARLGVRSPRSRLGQACSRGSK